MNMNSSTKEITIYLEHSESVLIENEHKRMRKFLTQLQNACLKSDTNNFLCNECDSGRIASCLGLLPSYSLDLIHVVGEHFHHEEKIMLSKLSPHNSLELHDHVKNHLKAHEKIMEGFDKVNKNCPQKKDDLNLQQIYKEMYELVTKSLTFHGPTFHLAF